MNKVKKAIIPAAGLGTRFLPITKAIPKPMLSVVDKPTIQYIAEELNGAGIEEIVIVVSPSSDAIRQHFGKNPELAERLLSDKKYDLYEIEQKTENFKVSFAVQESANGLAGAILCAEKYVKEGEPFALLLGDELIYTEENQKTCIRQLIDVFEKTGKSVIASMEVFGDDVSKYGNIGVKSEVDGIMTVSAIKEKPSLNEALSNNAIIGRYVLSGKVMAELKKLKPRNNELYLTDVLDDLAANGELLAYNFEGTRYDVGDKLGFLKANVEYAIRDKKLGEETKKYIKELSEKL